MNPNTLLYQSVRHAAFPFSLWNIRRHPDLPEVHEVELPEPFLGLVFNLERPFEYMWFEDFRSLFGHNAYNLAYLPAARYTVSIPEGLHHSLLLDVGAETIRRYTKDYPFLSDIANATQGNIPMVLRPDPLAISPILDADLSELLYHTTQDDLLRGHFFDVKAFDLLHHALRDFAHLIQPVTGPAPDAQEIYAAAHFLIEHLAANVTLEDLSREFGITKRKLQEGFRRQFRRTVHEFVIQHRMDTAKQMLRNASLSVKNVAVSVGYKDVSNFTAAFKKHYNQSPTAIRLDDTPNDARYKK